MRISKPTISETISKPDRVRVSVEISSETRETGDELLWFEFPHEYHDRIDTSGTPWIAALLPLAAKLREVIEIDAPVDAEFLNNSRQLMEWWAFWDPSLRPVDIRYDGICTSETNSKTSATFFSGGVDSFFTLVRHLDIQHTRDVSHLLIGHGFDIKIYDDAAFEQVLSRINDVAKQFGKTVLPFATNLRETIFKQLPWGEIGHGNAMAAAALLLSPRFQDVLIPSSDGYMEDKLWGTDPALDYLFSNSSTRIVHEGSAYSRLEKVAGIASVAGTLSHLRVCWRNFSSSNCGDCEKCYRTMIAIDIQGKLHEATSFAPGCYDLKKIHKIYCPAVKGSIIRIYYEDMVNKALENGRSDIARAIKTCMRRSALFRPLFALRTRLLNSVRLHAFGLRLDGFLQKVCLL